MIELINDDYADFVHLSSNLVSLQSTIDKIENDMTVRTSLSNTLNETWLDFQFRQYGPSLKPAPAMLFKLLSAWRRSAWSCLRIEPLRLVIFCRGILEIFHRAVKALVLSSSSEGVNSADFRSKSATEFRSYLHFSDFQAS